MKKYLPAYFGAWFIGQLAVELHFLVLQRKFQLFDDQLVTWLFSFVQTQIILILICTPIMLVTERFTSIEKRRNADMLISTILGISISVIMSAISFMNSSFKSSFIEYSKNALFIHFYYGVAGLYFGYFWNRARSKKYSSTHQQEKF